MIKNITNIIENEKYKCILLIAREHGLETLKNILENNKKYQVIAIFTHRLNPKQYDIERKERSDFKKFKEIADLNYIPLYTVDSKSEQEKLEKFTNQNRFDYLISVSWRYLIPISVFRKAIIGAINIHRGDLPKYAGVEPIKRALENQEKIIAVCAHQISEAFDEGKVLCKISHNVNYDKLETLEDNVERLKREITPYFPQLAMKSMKITYEEYMHGKK